MVSFDAIVRMCAGVHGFSRMAGWRWKALPVIQWEFSTLSEFARAVVELREAIAPQMLHARSDAEWQRATHQDTFEIEAHGVMLRLVCAERLALPDGRSAGVSNLQIRTTRLEP